MASLVLELALAALLIAALVFGWRLERRLKALRDSHAQFLNGVRDLDAAAARADAGLKALRHALDEAHEGLHDRIQKGRALKTELEALLVRAERSERSLASASPAQAGAQAFSPAVSAFVVDERPLPPDPSPRPASRGGEGGRARALPRFRDRGAA